MSDPKYTLVEYLATDRFAASNAAQDSFVSEFPVGLRVRADCQADGLRLGSVTGATHDAGTGRTLVDVLLDSGSELTANLTWVEHGCVDPDALPNHVEQHYIGGRDAFLRATTSFSGVVKLASAIETLAGAEATKAVTPAGLAAIFTPGVYARDARFAAKPVAVAADRYTLLSPNRMLVDVAGTFAALSSQQALDLSLAAAWDSVSTDYRVAANRAGKNFYVYACDNSGALVLLTSANATYPTGYSTMTSRKIGGLHCLCASVGTISGHALSGYVAGDILPASVWDLKHRPASSPEGMVYVAGIGKWADIYLASVSGGALVSAYNATCADGASATVFDWYDFSEWLARIGKRLPFQAEFMAAALGSNEGTNIAGSTDPGTTGGKMDTAGRRMLSHAGVEDCCGNLWQWGIEAGAVAGTAAWKDQFVAGRTTERGRGYVEPTRAFLGGHWNSGVYCGSRHSAWDSGPLALYSNCGARGIADAIEEI